MLPSKKKKKVIGTNCVCVCMRSKCVRNWFLSAQRLQLATLNSTRQAAKTYASDKRNAVKLTRRAVATRGHSEGWQFGRVNENNMADRAFDRAFSRAAASNGEEAERPARPRKQMLKGEAGAAVSPPTATPMQVSDAIQRVLLADKDKDCFRYILQVWSSADLLEPVMYGNDRCVFQFSNCWQHS